MQHYPPDHANLLLDPWGWRLDDLAEAVARYHKLAWYHSVHKPDGAATRQRLAGDTRDNLIAPASLRRASHDT